MKLNKQAIIDRLALEKDRLVHAFLREGRETQQALSVLWRLSQGKKVSAKDKKAAVHQLTDLAKLVPALAVFSLPGGMLLLPLLAKILPFHLLPTESFKSESDES